MKCSEFDVYIGFAQRKEPDKVKDQAAAQGAFNESLGGGEKLLFSYHTEGRCIVANFRMTDAALDKTGGNNGHPHKLLKLARAVAQVFPTMRDLVIYGYYVNNHRTCQWKYIYETAKDDGKTTMVPVYLRNKLCITDMTIEDFSKLLADWTEVMTGKTIGEFE